MTLVIEWFIGSSLIVVLPLCPSVVFRTISKMVSTFVSRTKKKTFLVQNPVYNPVPNALNVIRTFDKETSDRY